MKKLLTFTALGTILLAGNAMAAGFHLREQSAAAQGNAFAGATAGAENNSYAYFNAAGLTRQKGTQVNLGATYIVPRAEAGNVKDADGNRGQDINNIVHAAWAPNGTISHQIDDKLTVGLGLNVPFGMITKYDSEWAGSDHGITSKVMTSTFTPMAAYKVTDKLSVGAGLPIQYVKARLTNSAYPGMGSNDIGDASLKGDTVDVGYQLSALYELNEDTRFGINYRSEINHKLKGDISGSGGMAAMVPYLNQDISARLDTPAMLSVGAYHQINEKWAVMAEWQRVFWSSFKSLDLMGRDTMSKPGSYLISSTKENWRDTDFFALGASYQIDNQWKLRMGVAYDQTAVKKEHRTPRIPDSDRFWYSAGLSYQYSENLSFDMAYTYIQAKDASIDTSLNGNNGRNVTADYSNSVKLWGLSLNYKF